MICAWNSLLAIVPPWLRSKVDALGKESGQEVRLRLGEVPQIKTALGFQPLLGTVSRDDLQFCINAASKYSPWSAASAANGYITAPGGHRVGICGEMVMKNGIPSGISTVTSVNIRIARDIPNVSKGLPIQESILILGAPGWGKTTLIRDLSRRAADNYCVSVVDEREELFSDGFERGKHMDVLTGCPKPEGILMVLKTMGPEVIAVDEITGEQDAMALSEAAACGVRVLATAHASSLQDLTKRSAYLMLLKKNVFSKIAMLHPDKHFSIEEICI